MRGAVGGAEFEWGDQQVVGNLIEGQQVVGNLSEGSSRWC